MILFSLYSELHEEKIEKLRLMQKNEHALEAVLSMHALNMQKEFRMDPSVR
jgi:hypothetical protein